MDNGRFTEALWRLIGNVPELYEEVPRVALLAFDKGHGDATSVYENVRYFAGENAAADAIKAYFEEEVAEESDESAETRARMVTGALVECAIHAVEWHTLARKTIDMYCERREGFAAMPESAQIAVVVELARELAKEGVNG